MLKITSNKTRASPLRHIKILSTTCFKQFPAETATPVCYLVLGWHEYVAINLNFVTFLNDNGRSPITFRGNSFFQFSDIHKIQKKTLPVRFMTNQNLFNLLRSIILTKIWHLQNLFLQTITITNIDIFGDLGPGKFHTSNLSFFVTLLNFSSRSFPLKR